jgi:hypothetical protein
MNILSILFGLFLLALAGGLTFYFLSTPATINSVVRDIEHKFKVALRHGSELGGYVHDTAVYVWIPFTQFAHSAGTWTATVASNVWYARRSAADAAATTYIPLGNLLANAGATKGAYVKAIQVHFRVVTAALDALEAHLYKATLAADGTLLTVAEVTTTYDTGHDAAAERIDVDEHLMTLTPSTPFWIDGDGSYYFVEVVADAAATSLLDYFGANVSLTVRL